MAPRGPQRAKINSDGFSGGFGPQCFTKKILSIFGTGCHKACTCPLNGASVIFLTAGEPF